MKVLLVGLNAKFIHSSLALYSIDSACRAAGHETEVAEYTINQEFLHVVGDIAGRAPSVVGIACYIWNREMVLKIAAALKKVLPEIMILLGGPEASGDATEILLRNPSVDFVVQGEGEESVPELLTELARGSGGRNVSGIAVRCGAGADTNGGIRLVGDLDSLPFPYRSEAMAGLKDRIIYYESSRGCPFCCSYCVSSTTSGVRYRSLEKVREELRFFLQHEVKQVKFVDRTFNVQPEHYRGIWKFLAEEPGTTCFHFEIVADLLHREDVQWLAGVAPGKFQFEIGVQSTYEDALSAIGRRNDWARLQDNVQGLLGAANIHLHLDLIVGLPREDRDHFRQSFNAVYGLKPHMMQIGFLKLLPGTKIRQEAARYGYICLEHPPYEILSNNVLSFPEVRQLKILEEVFNQTYNSGRFFFTLTYLVRIFAGDAFSFYITLARWWEREGLAGKSHSPEGVLSGLLLFSGGFSLEQQRQVAELLKFDALLDPSGALKGEKLDWNRHRWEARKNELWRNEAALSRFIRNYTFTNWRDVKRKYPIEVFEYDIPRWVETGEGMVKEPTPVVFEAAQPHPGWHVLPADDFFVEDMT